MEANAMYDGDQNDNPEEMDADHVAEPSEPSSFLATGDSGQYCVVRDERAVAESLMLQRVRMAMDFVHMCEHKEGLRFDRNDDRHDQKLIPEVASTEKHALNLLSDYFLGLETPKYPT